MVSERSYDRLYIWGPNRFSNLYLADQIESLCDFRPKCLESNVDLKGLRLDSDCLLFCDCDLKQVDEYCDSVHEAVGREMEKWPSLVLCNVDKTSDIAGRVLTSKITGVFYSTDEVEQINSGIGEVLLGNELLPHGLLLESLHLARKLIGDIPVGGKEVRLTTREHDILELIISGCTNLMIGERLGISSNTVKAHVSNLYRKIGAVNRVQAIIWFSNRRQ